VSGPLELGKALLVFVLAATAVSTTYPKRATAHCGRVEVRTKYCYDTDVGTGVHCMPWINATVVLTAGTVVRFAGATDSVGVVAFPCVPAGSYVVSTPSPRAVLKTTGERAMASNWGLQDSTRVRPDTVDVVGGETLRVVLRCEHHGAGFSVKSLYR
jgi:hypothetical protein